MSSRNDPRETWEPRVEEGERERGGKRGRALGGVTQEVEDRASYSFDPLPEGTYREIISRYQPTLLAGDTRDGIRWSMATHVVGCEGSP